MDSKQQLQRGTALILLVILVPAGALASGARQGVQPRPGEMVLLRDVSTRPAYRPAPPGMALIADPSPQRELAGALGTSTGLDELSDDDYAALGANVAVGPGAGQQTVVERVTGTAVNGTLGRVVGGNGALSGDRLRQAIGGPTGMVGGTTRGIGDQVRGALAQFPLGQGAGAGN